MQCISNMKKTYNMFSKLFLIKGRENKMAREKKLTRRQRELLTKNGFDYEKWTLKTQDSKSYTYIHKDTKEVMKLSFYA